MLMNFVSQGWSGHFSVRLLGAAGALIDALVAQEADVFAGVLCSKYAARSARELLLANLQQN